MSERLMIVDDSPSMRELVGFALREAGYSVELASSAEEAIGMMQGERYSMVITDLNMPGMNGIELIRSIRQCNTHRFIPVVMLTTESSEKRKLEGREAGASAWLVKPFTPEVLVGTVKRFVR